jgi:hypothetical protein
MMVVAMGERNHYGNYASEPCAGMSIRKLLFPQQNRVALIPYNRGRVFPPERVGLP